jgi:uncharacterized membrane protein YccC
LALYAQTQVPAIAGTHRRREHLLLRGIEITGEVVVLLSVFEHMPVLAAMEARLFDTLLGSLLALSAYILWPGWGKKPLTELLATLIGDERLYFEFLVTHTPSRPLSSAAALYYRQQIRLARTNALAGLNRVIGDSSTAALSGQAASGLLTAIHRFHEGLVALEYLLVHQSLGKEEVAPGFLDFSEKLDRELQQLEDMVRHSESQPALDINPVEVDLSMKCRGSEVSADPEESDLKNLQWRLSRNVSTMARMLPAHGQEMV